MSSSTHDDIRSAVRKHYGDIAAQPAEQAQNGCCAPASAAVEVEVPCCGGSTAQRIVPARTSLQLGYSEKEIEKVPEGANLGLGCGNPIAIASLKPGERVLDLGSGGGFDCFLAAEAVGPTGHVIGVDMTPDMITRARGNAERGTFTNVEFRLGKIEHLPAADNSIDVLISNCVINLSPEKEQVFREAYRVLAPGGRIAITDIVLTADLPKAVLDDPRFHCACVAGASPIDTLHDAIAAAGFRNIRIAPKEESKEFIREWVPGASIDRYIVSAVIEAEK